MRYCKWTDHSNGRLTCLRCYAYLPTIIVNIQEEALTSNMRFRQWTDALVQYQLDVGFSFSGLSSENGKGVVSCARCRKVTAMTMNPGMNFEQ